MTTIYLARHGQTEENLMRIFQGHLPGTLTADGIEQARNLGKELEGITIDCILSSDLKRVIDTVNYAMANRHLPWEKTKLLREIDWGKWTGLKIDSVDKQNPPEDAETKEMLYERGKRIVEYIKEKYSGKNVLVVAHGLINRSIQAHILGVDINELYNIPHMKNAEVRKFTL
ncbi:histidine phosphatase family protein [Bacteroides caecigallinarum]|uniref:histidine phosphatase family protein n=1 Tax=Bacteroides caecigallinarum TaxID=1411144 RepID=UPI001F15F4EB|nr:histidine phosphatase family protein [Bacteroides caecigallinarum]MCF2580497.1 histidine phosphatase family protein [Bacteroides caecigallinarum]